MCAGTQKSKFQPRRGSGRGRGELCCEMGHCEQLYELQLPPCSRRPGPSPAGCKGLAGLSAFWGSLCLSTTHGRGRSPLKRSIQVSMSDISKSAREGFEACREPELGWQMEGAGGGGWVDDAGMVCGGTVGWWAGGQRPLLHPPGWMMGERRRRAEPGSTAVLQPSHGAPHGFL